MNWIKKIFWKRKGTGVIPQLSDSRDYKYQKVELSNEINKVDLRDKFPPVTNQGSYNSCTAHAVCALLDYELKYNKKFEGWDFDTSEAFTWYCSRNEEGTSTKNVGVQLRNVFKSIKKYGFVRQESFNYSNNVYDYPGDQVMIEGQLFDLQLKNLPSYYVIDGISDIKDSLDHNHPVVFAFPVSDDFMYNDKEIFIGSVANDYGFHGMLIVGYNDYGFIIRNSWGKYWGKDGYTIIGFNTLINNAFDLWCLQ